ncbi:MULTISPECIES: hypothetical protein [Streptomyces]|uniref:hypothetical protein n=1 Tax=Streptomyces TaxID=1883 RepID=UPI00163D3927|nr:MULTISPECIES: hypothetical protein [Streptomyces]MBC2879420.1 hypothetical protein [Streptomyces sp. TYQ1024]UBI39820.1 hypothetical protein K7I03_27320 [Streptomyces mobaraensis]UKW32401.1 hypothetical protein MCU78_27255 [Streptomyces sp. TYQ1024]
MDFTVIANAVEVDHGIKRLSMRFIKKYAAPERFRLSPELCEQISKALEEQGLITLPRRLPTTENEFVFVIQKDSPLGESIQIARYVTIMDTMGTSPIPGLKERFPGLLAQLA